MSTPRTYTMNEIVTAMLYDDNEFAKAFVAEVLDARADVMSDMWEAGQPVPTAADVIESSRAAFTDAPFIRYVLKLIDTAVVAYTPSLRSRIKIELVNN